MHRAAAELQALQGPAHEAEARLAGADDEHRRGGGIGEQRRIGKAHHRRAVDDDEVEHFQARPTAATCRRALPRRSAALGGSGPEAMKARLVVGVAWKASGGVTGAGQVVAEADGIARTRASCAARGCADRHRRAAPSGPCVAKCRAMANEVSDLPSDGPALVMTRVRGSRSRW